MKYPPYSPPRQNIPRNHGHPQTPLLLHSAHVYVNTCREQSQATNPHHATTYTTAAVRNNTDVLYCCGRGAEKGETGFDPLVKYAGASEITTQLRETAARDNYALVYGGAKAPPYTLVMAKHGYTLTRNAATRPTALQLHTGPTLWQTLQQCVYMFCITPELHCYRAPRRPVVHRFLANTTYSLL